MSRHKVGIGAVNTTTRNGFSEHDQRSALAECKIAQFRIQEGCCILCTRPMNIRVAKWVSSRGATATLTEWAWVLKRKFDQATLCTELLHRSPDEIRAEYANGSRGHELACHGCASRFHNTLYGEAGPGAAYRRVYAQVVQELGLTEEEQHDQDRVAHIHQTVVERLATARANELLSPKKFVRVDDVVGLAPRKTRKAGTKQRKLRHSQPSAPTAQLSDLEWVKENKRALEQQDEVERERLEREERELLASYTNRVDSPN